MPEIKPTDDNYEREKGRIAIWLDPDDVRWLGKLLGSFTSNDDEPLTSTPGRILFRLMAAMHKAGLSHSKEEDESSDEKTD